MQVGMVAGKRRNADQVIDSMLLKPAPRKRMAVLDGAPSQSKSGGEWVKSHFRFSVWGVYFCEAHARISAARRNLMTRECTTNSSAADIFRQFSGEMVVT